jgi:hypothetical protein
MPYKVYLCGPSDCPVDPEFTHETIFGGPSCVPRDMSLRTGRSKSHRQTATDIGLPYKVYLWDGGCDAAGHTARRKIEEHNRRNPADTIVLEMEP